MPRAQRRAPRLDDLPDSVIAFTPEGEILSWNEGAQRVYGYSADEVAALGSRLKEMLVPPDQQDEVQRWTERAMAGGVVSYETVRRHKNGTLVYVDIALRAIRDEAGAVTHIVATARDVTRPRCLQQARLLGSRYGGILEAAPDAMMIVNRDGRMVLVNSQLERLFGYARDEVLGEPLEMLVPERFRPRHPGHRTAYFADPRKRPMGASLDLFARRRDGTEFPVEISLSPMESEEGPLVIAAIRDITERRRQEDLRRQADDVAMREVLQASRMKSEFLANMSHELRTPLNAIIGFGQLVRDGRAGPVTETQKEFLGDILAGSTHLLQIINDVLDLSKVESGHLDFHPETVDLRWLAADVRDTLRGDAKERGIRVDLEVASDLPSLAADPARLRQVLLNFLSNALKFTRPEGRVTIRARREDAASYRIEVEDTGIGIREEDLPRLFVEFQQLDAGPGKRHAGTGLGLALCKRLVEAQGGRVFVKSVHGQGSTFGAVLPLAPSGAAASAMPASTTAPTVGTRARHVLVVDDNPTNLKLLRLTLSGEGYEVQAVSSAEEALDEVARRAPDLVVTDLQMPGITGFDLAQRLKADPATRHIPILALTAYAMKGDEQKALDAGCDAYVSKPFQPSQLLLRIAGLLGTVPAAR